MWRRSTSLKRSWRSSTFPAFVSSRTSVRMSEIVLLISRVLWMDAVNAAMPVTGNWVCNLEGSAKQAGDALVITEEEDGDRWIYRLTRTGDHLVFSQEGPKGEEHSPPVCGMNGSMTGSYFPVAKSAGK